MSTHPQLWLLALYLASALAAALLAWLLLDRGSALLAAYHRTFDAGADRAVRELFLSVSPARLFTLNLLAIAALGALAWMLTGSVFLTLLAVGITALAPRLVLRVARQRRLTRLEAQLPGTLQMIAGSMKAGVSLMQAIEQVTHESPAPMSQELTKLLEEQRLGRPLDEALAALARRVPLQSMQLATSAIRMAADVGGPLAETMERLAQSLRTKLAIESKIRSLTSQGKAQALIIGALPFFLMIALTWLEPTEMRLMFSTTAGYAVLAVIVLLELAGWLLIRKIVNIDV